MKKNGRNVSPEKIAFFVLPRFAYQITTILKLLSIDEYDVIDPSDESFDSNQYNCAVTIHSTQKKVKEIFDRFKAFGIPTIIIQDGIIEYRHLKKTQRQAAQNSETKIPRYMPVYSDYFFAFGSLSSHFVENTGFNLKKIQVTGCARMDPFFNQYTQADRRIKFHESVISIGLATANTPGFNRQENLKTCKLVLEIYNFFAVKKKRLYPRIGASLVL